MNKIRANNTSGVLTLKSSAGYTIIFWPVLLTNTSNLGPEIRKESLEKNKLLFKFL